MKPAKAKAVAKQSKDIPGWFSQEASMLFAWIDEIQKRNNISGDCFEIGCHHGKSALMLGTMLDAGSENYLCVICSGVSQIISRGQVMETSMSSI